MDDEAVSEKTADGRPVLRRGQHPLSSAVQTDDSDTR